MPTAQPKYFRIPRASLITLPRGFTLSTTGDVYVAFDDTRAWGYVDQPRGRVVVMDLLPASRFNGDVEYRTLVAYDGDWADQLLEWSANNPIFGSIYEYEKRSNILNIPSTYTEINHLVRPTLPAGVYEVGFSLTWTYTQNNSTVFIRWSTDGGGTFAELQFEVPTSTTVIPTYYAYPYIRVEGPADIIVQARKASGSGTFDVNFSDLWLEKKADT
jgi:hypothetical protein